MENNTSMIEDECVKRLPNPILKIIAKKYAEVYYSEYYFAKQMKPNFIKNDTTDTPTIKCIYKIYNNIYNIPNHYLNHCILLKNNKPVYQRLKVKSIIKDKNPVINIMFNPLSYLTIHIEDLDIETILYSFLKIACYLMFNENNDSYDSFMDNIIGIGIQCSTIGNKTKSYNGYTIRKLLNNKLLYNI